MAREWLEAYRRSWEEADADAVAKLFSGSAAYRSHIFQPPHVGRDAIRAYWRRATSTQTDVGVRVGEPLVQDRRAVAEWWTVMHDEDDGNITLPGCLVLRAHVTAGAMSCANTGTCGAAGTSHTKAGACVEEGSRPRRWNTPVVGSRATRQHGSPATSKPRRASTPRCRLPFTPFRPPHHGREGVRAYTGTAYDRTRPTQGSESRWRRARARPSSTGRPCGRTIVRSPLQGARPFGSRKEAASCPSRASTGTSSRRRTIHRGVGAPNRSQRGCSLGFYPVGSLTRVRGGNELDNRSAAYVDTVASTLRGTLGPSSWASICTALQTGRLRCGQERHRRTGGVVSLAFRMHTRVQSRRSV
jgi:SnoaL-like domain